MDQVITIAVKELAEITSKSGDLNNDFTFNVDPTEGQKAHKYIQNKYNKESSSEFYIDGEEKIDEYIIHLQGKIDGVVKENDNLIIEELKTTKRDLKEIDESYHLEHLAQLKIYMALYAKKYDIEKIDGRLVYIYNDTYETKAFTYTFTENDLRIYLNDLLKEYLSWLKIIEKNNITRKLSVDKIRFPYKTMREGQKEMMQATFYAIKNHKSMFINAPTGIGKTISSMYPSVKSIKSDTDKLFYLTSKNSQKSLAVKAFNDMLNNGLDMRLIVLTSKENICPLGQSVCQMDECPYAKGFFQREREAIKEIISKEYLITKDVILNYSSRYMLCPFEFSLDVSLFCEVVVCDYNYVYDPIVKLIRYFEGENTLTPIVLVDEAHNLVSRSNEMYSASLSTKLLKELKKGLRGKKPSISGKIKSLMDYLNTLNDFENNRCILEQIDDKIINYLLKINEAIFTIFKEYDATKFKNKTYLTLLGFEIKRFLKIAELYTVSHRFIIERFDDDYLFNIVCLDASSFLSSINKNLQASIFFSATLEPLNYYKSLLNGGEGEFLRLPAVFSNKNRDLIFLSNVSTKYNERKKSVDNICDAISIMVNAKKGNYICFFPSYEYLLLVAEELSNYITIPIIIQERNMLQDARDKIIDLFMNNSNEKIGLFVMGGVFSEGIDYLGDALSGVLIVGLGLPQINYLNEMCKDYFEAKFQKGFDYTYRYPGFNKVLQSAGRVIRSENDRGVIIIADSRIVTKPYLDLLPKDWYDYKEIKNNVALYKELKQFWNLI